MKEMTNQLNKHGAQPLSRFDALFDVLSKYQSTKKTTSKGVSGAICVNNLIGQKRVNWEQFRAIRLSGRHKNSWVRTLSEDDNARSRWIRLREDCECLCNRIEVLLVRKAYDTRPRFCFSLIPN